MIRTLLARWRRDGQPRQQPIIESWRDLLMVGVGLVAIAIALVAITAPVAAVYLLARHIGLATTEAAVVAAGLTPLVIARALGGI